MPPKGGTAHLVARPNNIVRLTEWNGLVKGDAVDVIGCEEGDFTFAAHCTNDKGSYVECFGGISGTVSCRSFAPERVVKHSGSSFGIEVIRSRKRHGWTRERLSTQTGLSTSVLSRIERGGKCSATEAAIVRETLGMNKLTNNEETE